MRLYQQLVLFMLAATVLPLALVGFWLLRGAEQELTRRIGSEQHARAEAAAQLAAQSLLGAVDQVARAAELFDWERSSPEELQGGLRLLYQQSPLVSAVILVDSEGATLASPVFAHEGVGEHPPFDPTGVPALTRAIDLGPLKGGRGQAAVSTAYPDAQRRRAAVALAVRLSNGERSPFVLAELGLGALSADLASRAGPETGRLDVVDAGGRVVASSAGASPLVPLEPALWQAVQGALDAPRSASVPVALPERLLVSATRVPGQLGLITVASVDERTALGPVRRMRQTVLVSIGAALAVLLALGAAFTRRLTRRLQHVVGGAESFARGELSARIPVSGADELTELADTFNRMGGEIEAARARLERWNDDLRQKVDEATAELRAAQAQLLETQKLAAVGQLGAGVAHEINNPLAGILGNVQLLLLDRDERDADFHVLTKVEQAAKRCKEITQNLLRFSQQRERPELRPVDLNTVVHDACLLITHQTLAEGVSLTQQLHPAPLKVNGDPGHLSQVLLALVFNARTAMHQSLVKELRISTRVEEDAAILEVRDTGKGIQPEHLPRIFEPFFTTKDVWSNVGLGLSVAYRMVSEHQGKIDVATEPGKGSTFTLRLPKLA